MKSDNSCWNEVVILDTVVKKVSEEMTFKQVSKWREGESSYLEWMNGLGRGQSKCEGPKQSLFDVLKE